VRLEAYGNGQHLSHEETMSGPKEDRSSCFAHGNEYPPILASIPTMGTSLRSVESLLFRTPLEATDHLGVVSRLWPIADERVING
jgi:hypothetical protein